MSENHTSSIRRILETVFLKLISDGKMEPDRLADLKLRPPSNEGFGDLCSNCLMLFAQEEDLKGEDHAALFIEPLKGLTFVQSVDVASNGYLNITIKPSYWFDRVVGLLNDFKAFELSAATTLKGRHQKVEVPQNSEGLTNARRVWNAEALGQLAVKLDCQLVTVPGQESQQAGFPAQAAIAKCGLARTRLAVLSNAPDFSVNFSPVLAIDASYDNPVFSLPYAHARIRSMLARVEKVSADGQLLHPISDSSFELNQRHEKQILKMVCDWPDIAVQTWEKRDMLHLFSFLQDLTLLFFALVEKERPQSTDYLMETEKGGGRQLLFRAVDRLICEGLGLVDFDILEEFV
ncbi:DALR anticodon-binding domain-containing protein [Sneathiella aquimaris]|uniref:DALR anticodon-binding domain-containing protein n=1 Tax=Sneathiella aquimaris TaxID=2599305 RepID=UPI00146F2A58|nr:DALR anticodon-binding domain-containing protein [Sneathiella aquimaris]